MVATAARSTAPALAGACESRRAEIRAQDHLVARGDEAGYVGREWRGLALWLQFPPSPRSA